MMILITLVIMSTIDDNWVRHSAHVFDISRLQTFLPLDYSCLIVTTEKQNRFKLFTAYSKSYMRRRLLLKWITLTSV